MIHEEKIDTQPSAPETPEKVALEGCQRELQEWKDKFIAVSADFQNFKKRIEKEQNQLTRMAYVRVVTPLLEIVDHFERALAEQARAALDDETKKRLSGFSLIHQELLKMLAKLGVIPMENYTTFDPHLHEALMQVDAPDQAAGTIVQVLQPGYLMNGEVIRIAKVSVAR